MPTVTIFVLKFCLLNPPILRSLPICVEACSTPQTAACWTWPCLGTRVYLHVPVSSRISLNHFVPKQRDLLKPLLNRTNFPPPRIDPGLPSLTRPIAVIACFPRVVNVARQQASRRRRQLFCLPRRPVIWCIRDALSWFIILSRPGADASRGSRCFSFVVLWYKSNSRLCVLCIFADVLMTSRSLATLTSLARVEGGWPVSIAEQGKIRLV